MSSLANQLPAKTYGSLLNLASGTGLQNTLTPIQDGTGFYSNLQLSKLAFNITTTGAKFQIDGVELTATATQLNQTGTTLTSSPLMFNSIVGFPNGRLFKVGSNLTLDSSIANELTIDLNPTLTGNIDINTTGALVTQIGNPSSSVTILGLLNINTIGANNTNIGNAGSGSLVVDHINTFINSTGLVQIPSATISINTSDANKNVTIGLAGGTSRFTVNSYESTFNSLSFNSTSTIATIRSSVFLLNITGTGTTTIGNPSSITELKSGTINLTNITSSAGTALVASGVDNQMYLLTSSLRFKEDIQPLDVDTSKLYELEAVTYQYKGREDRGFGYIAEDVDKLLPCLINYDDKHLPFSINYMQMNVLMVEELKKLKARLDALELQN